jgi:predicted permease
MTVILSTVIPVACIVLVGFIAGKKLDFDRSTLSHLVLYVLAPALIVHVLYITTLNAKNAAAIFFGFALTYLLSCFAAWLLARQLRLSVPVQKSLIATTAFPNSGNMGLAVSSFALGAEGLDRAVVYLIAFNVFVFATAPAFLQGGSWRSQLRAIFKLPLVWAVLVGLALRVFGVELPFKLGESLHMMGQAAIPVALLLLGMQIATNPFKFGLYEVGASLMRLLGGAAIAYLAGKIIGLSGVDLQVLILQSSMPSAVISFLLVDEFGGDAPRTARVVAVSTLLCFVTLPLVLWAIGAGG